MTKAQRAEVVRLAKEAQLGDKARRDDAAQLASALAERKEQNPHHPRGCNAVQNVIFKHPRALCRVRPGFMEPFDDDDATDEEQAQLDFDLKFDGDDGDDSNMGGGISAATRAHDGRSFTVIDQENNRWIYDSGFLTAIANNGNQKVDFK
ncbi:hypothetical protein HAX54_031339 [Datura stramonium]|uniref:Uncharacterized protein n=1 Tax=Datura stramonium TaxID=4076 RepID=A0ABS8SBX6_DATST|nr:hypothetical protein [Datura stramonium]